MLGVPFVFPFTPNIDPNATDELNSWDVLLPEVLGSGCYRIGASVEFDWSSVSAVRRDGIFGRLVKKIQNR